jgi:hypothetical protein
VGRRSTRKHKFLEEFLADPAKNGTEAARKAGWSEATAKQAAWNLLHRDPWVKKELQDRLGVAMAKAEATVEDVVADVLKLRGEAELVGDRNLRLKCNEFLGKYLGMFIERHEDVGVTALIEQLDRARKKVSEPRLLERAEAEKFLLGTGADADFEELPVAADSHPAESERAPTETPTVVPPAAPHAKERKYDDWVGRLV